MKDITSTGRAGVETQVPRPRRVGTNNIDDWLGLSEEVRSDLTLSRVTHLNASSADWVITRTLEHPEPHRGLGLVGRKPVGKQVIVGEYVGHNIDGMARLHHLYPQEDECKSEYVYDSDFTKGGRRQYICAFDVRVANHTRWVNHCGVRAPNLEAITDGSGRVYFRTLRHIAAGEEYLVDYGSNFFSNFSLR